MAAKPEALPSARTRLSKHRPARTTSFTPHCLAAPSTQATLAALSVALNDCAMLLGPIKSVRLLNNSPISKVSLLIRQPRSARPNPSLRLRAASPSLFSLPARQPGRARRPTQPVTRGRAPRHEPPRGRGGDPPRASARKPRCTGAALTQPPRQTSRSHWRHAVRTPREAHLAGRSAPARDHHPSGSPTRERSVRPHSARS